MRRLVRWLSVGVSVLSLVSCGGAQGTEPKTQHLDIGEDTFNFIVANDLGRNGYYDQKMIAEEMGTLAENVDIEFVAAAGDVHHFEGVASVDDPLWMTNYELIYSHPELMLDWYPILGNHEYRGNTQAVLDYGTVSRRWVMSDRYYAKSFEVDDTTSMTVVFVDTTPLIDKYHKESEDKYRDVAAQSIDEQLAWIDSTLMASDDTWKIVIGHHPIYADTDKDDEERINMQERLDPILRRNGVDMYICGHIHNFQHIRPADSDIDYVVNTSGSLSRDVKPVEGTVFCSSATGFSVVSAAGDKLVLYMLDKNGIVIHTVERMRE
mgnify:CR=1 FL=1